MSNDRAQIFDNYCSSSGPAAKLLLDVLSCYLCPHKCDNTNSCPFGHSGEEILRKLPTYICVNYLLARCKNYIVAVDPSQCSDGFHPAVEDLIDLDAFNQKVALELLSSRLSLVQPLLGPQSSSSFGSNKRSRSNSALNTTSTNNNNNNNTSHLKAGNTLNSNATNPEEDDPNECAICYENPRTRGQHFGLLEMCSHVFCAPCLTSWITSPGDQKACPMCRVYSSRAIIWPESRINSKKVKRQIFDYNLSCVRVYQQNHSTVAQGVDQGAVNGSQGTAPGPSFGLTVRIPGSNAQRTHQHWMNTVDLSPMQSPEPIPIAGLPMSTAGSPMPIARQPPITSDQENNAYRNRLIQRSFLNVQSIYGLPNPNPQLQLRQQQLQQQPQLMVPLTGASTGSEANRTVNIIRNAAIYQQQLQHQPLGSFGSAHHHSSHIGPPLDAVSLNSNATPYQPLNHLQQQQQPPTHPQLSDLVLRLLNEG